MTDPHDDPFGVDRLDGHTLEQLSDYLDAGRVPYDASIEESAGCQIALAALERLRTASLEALAEADDAPPPDETWVQAVMAGIVMDAHAGRDIPVSHPDPRVRLAVTEGALRELVRSIGDAVPGVLIGRVKLAGDVETLGAPIAVELAITVGYGTAIPVAAATVRERVREALHRHADLSVAEIVVTVTDIHHLPEEPA